MRAILRGALVASGAVVTFGCTDIPTGGSKDAAGGIGPPGSVTFAISGEALVHTGAPFPASPGGIAFVDGWEISFDEVLTTVDHVALSETPDRSPSDPSQTGAVVAQIDGPWVVDLRKKGTLPGKGGPGDSAIAIATLLGQNRNGDRAFDPERRYALSFEIVSPSPRAVMLNLSEQARTDYTEMISTGYTSLFVGTATFKGAACASSDPTYDFTRLPRIVRFRFGFSTPVAYRNCQNPDNDPAEPFGGEEHQRGVLIRENAPTVAQLTIHTDHLFWEAIAHDAPLHFDMIAARYLTPSTGPGDAGKDSGAPPVTRLEDFIGAPFAPFLDASGSPLPWRACVDPGDYVLPFGAVSFDTKGANVRDYYEYEQYNESTLGHLNADGLCFVARRYPSPN